MKLSIVTVCIDPDRPIIERFFSSLEQYTQDYEIIIVNNDGNDKNTSNFLESKADQYVHLDERVTVGAAWNIGAKKAASEFVLVTNDDVIFSRNWFENMSEVFEDYPKTGMVVPVMNYALIEQTHIGDVFHLDEACPIRLTPFKQFVWGAFMLFKKVTLTKAGYFSEEYDTAGGEDLDICFRMFESELEIYVDHRVFIYHEWGSTGDRILGDKKERELYKQNYHKFTKIWKKYTYDW